MRRTDKPKEPDEPLLFDLPLAGPADPEPAEPPLAERRRPAARDPRPPARPVPVPAPEPPELEDDEPVSAGSEFAGRSRRFAAGGADLLVHASVGVIALLGTRGMGVRPSLASWPAFAVFLLSFSFLYSVLPLAFWGHTLGMAWAAITSCNRDGEPLTFDQTVRRWLSGILTVATLGLPLLVTGDRRSLTDVLSGSATYPEEGPA
jgi:uncharacterized RDD family membrane protein YckC